MQLLPAIDILEGKVVRLAKGDYNAVTVYNDSPIDQAKAFEEMGAEWIHVVDLDGARSGNPSNLPLIEDILAKTMLKVEMGGGIRTMDTLQRIWDAGVNRPPCSPLESMRATAKFRSMAGWVAAAWLQKRSSPKCATSDSSIWSIPISVKTACRLAST